MTINCEYDSVVGVILPVENKILPIEIDKNTPTFCQKHSGYVFASGKNGSDPNGGAKLTQAVCQPRNSGHVPLQREKSAIHLNYSLRKLRLS